jgi:TDG/mug DNA glycosylase family protein
VTVLPDIISRRTVVLFCGSAAGQVSARQRAYYANKGNQFWQALHEVGLTVKELKPRHYHQVMRYGLGLTDLAKRVAGMDHRVNDSDLDRSRLFRLVRRYRPLIIAFNGKRSAELFVGRKLNYGLVPSKAVHGARMFVLPSTSGAARRHWDIRHWKRLSKWKRRYRKSR